MTAPLAHRTFPSRSTRLSMAASRTSTPFGHRKRATPHAGRPPTRRTLPQTADAASAARPRCGEPAFGPSYGSSPRTRLLRIACATKSSARRDSSLPTRSTQHAFEVVRTGCATRHPRAKADGNSRTLMACRVGSMRPSRQTSVRSGSENRTDGGCSRRSPRRCLPLIDAARGRVTAGQPHDGVIQFLGKALLGTGRPAPSRSWTSARQRSAPPTSVGSSSSAHRCANVRRTWPSMLLFPREMLSPHARDNRRVSACSGEACDKP